MLRLLVCLIMFFVSGHALAATQINVFAAASLRDALTDAVNAFKDRTPSADVRMSFAGSSVLARQIVAGAPAALFISANVTWMDHIEAHDRVLEGSRKTLVRNELVLISKEPGPPITLTPETDFQALLGSNRLAIALVDAVPAGMYAKAALTDLGQWDVVAPSLAQTDNVRMALKLVALGEAPFGIVYATDAQAEPGVHVRGSFPYGSHPQIEYPSALLRTDRDQATQALAEGLHQFLYSNEAQAVFRQHRFRTDR